MKKLFDAEEYQNHIPLFLSDNKSGYVHSVFQNGLNIRMGDSLFFIGTTRNGRIPFGVHLEQQAIQELVSRAQVQSPVMWDEASQQLRLAKSQFAINFKKGRSYMDKVNKIEGNGSPLFQNFEDFLTVLVNYGEPTGLDLDIEQFMLDYAEEKQAESETVRQIHLLIDAVFSNDRQEVEQVLRYFLGRGKGLTPSGDDHVVGMLSIHAATDALQPTFIQAVKDLVEKESITTDVGLEYLKYALKGEFSSPVTNVMNDLTQNKPASELQTHMLELLPMGHSSGVDTAFGMLIGMLALRRNKVWEKK